MSDIRSFFAGGSAISSKTQSGNKPAPPKQTKKATPKKDKPSSDPNLHKDGGPKVVVDKKKPVASTVNDGPSSSAPSSSKHLTDGDMAPSSSSKKKQQQPVASSVKNTIVLSDSDEDMTEAMPASSKSKAKGKERTSAAKRKKKVVESSDDDEDEEEEEAKPKKASANGKGKGKAKASTSKRTKEDDDFIDDEGDESTKPKKKAAPRKSNTKPSPKKVKLDDDNEPEEPDEKPKPKFKWQPKERAGPVAPGSKVVPEGEPNCLAGLTFVFTGELESLGRDEATNLAKRYGARVTSGPSSKTSYVVLGSDFGPKKMETIKKYNLKTLDEDGFLELIGTRGAREVDEKTIKKQQEEEKKIKEVAKSLGPAVQNKADEAAAKDMLWTVKYAPTSVRDICGNKGMVTKLQEWLHNWHKNRHSDFKKPGKDGTGQARAMMIYGPPGIGKTTAAHLVAKLEGFDVIELNASDTRSKKLLQAEFSNTTGQTGIAGFYKQVKGDDVDNENKHNIVLIMDEVDGMSAGDRGGVGALTALIKKTQIPIILIANDMSLPKMKPLKHAAFQLQFRRPTANEIRSRMLSVCFKEKLKIPANVVDHLIAGSQSDIRQVLNMMSTFKLGGNEMDFDQGQTLARMNEKNTITTPWNLMNKLFAQGTWASNSGLSLSEKEGIYFIDHDMLPMFVQDSYLRYTPQKARGDQTPMGDLTRMRLVSQAADAIADGDLIGGMIRGAQQWSLMPLHAQMSCVTPAFHMHGLSSGGYGMGFPAWFGKNSTQSRLARQLGEVQIRMRLKVSGDRREIRQSYLPILFPMLFDPLASEGAEAIEGVIGLMDDYYLGREEWDTIVELVSIGEEPEAVMKRIDTKTKSAFTRQYNKQNHPIPYHKADSSAAKPQKKLAGEPAPDLEDAMEVDDASEEEAELADDDDGEDLSKDKLIKSKAKGAAGKGKAPGKGKGKVKKEE